MSFWNRKKKNKEVEYWKGKYDYMVDKCHELEDGNPYKMENERLIELNDSLNVYINDLENEVHNLKGKAYRYDKLVENGYVPTSTVGVRISDLDDTIRFLTDFKTQLLENMEVDKD